MRALLFTLWVQADRSVSGTLELLNQLTLAQKETVEQGGARMINASLSGKSFSYELPPNWGAFEFSEMLRYATKMVEVGGPNQSMMTDEMLKAYVLDTSNQVTDTILARVNYNNLRR